MRSSCATGCLHPSSAPDSLFIVRGSRRDAARVRAAAAAALRAGDRVAVFPEGTTTDGTTVGRFFPALFQAAVDTCVPVQPVALRYLDARGRRTQAPVFIGDMTFLASVARVVAAPSLRAELAFGPLLHPAGRTRKELAWLARRWITRTLGLEPDVPALARRAA